MLRFVSVSLKLCLDLPKYKERLSMIILLSFMVLSALIFDIYVVAVGLLYYQAKLT